MTVELFAENQAATTVTSGGTTAPAGGTPETWTVASSAMFPAALSTAVPPTQFHVADTATGFTSEIIAVTNVSGTTWTVTRGAEGTTPVAHSAGFTIVQVVTTGWLGSVQGVAASGDATGATDTAAILAAQTALDGAGKILLGAGEFYLTCGQLVIDIPGVYIQGAGRWATIINAVGTGDVIRAFTTSNYSSGGGGPAGGGIKGLTIDGTNAGAGSSGVHVGDLYNYELDCGARHFQGSGSKAFWFDNNYVTNGMEQLTGRIWAETSLTHVQFDVNAATSYTPSGSFDRTNLKIFLDGKGKGNLVVLNNGAFIVDGDLGIYGNTDYGASTYYVLTLTGPAGLSFTATHASPAVFTATGSAFANGTTVQLSGGSLPAGFTAGTTYYVVAASGTSFELAATSGGTAINSTSTGSGTVQSLTYSYISNSVLNIGVECNGTSGTQPGTISFGAVGPTGNYIEGCTGLIDFSGNNAFAGPNNASENFQFDGPLYGASGALQRTFGFGMSPYQFGALTSNSTIPTRYVSIARVEPAANVTGIAMSGFDPLSGQVFWLVNDSAFTITFAAKSTSNVMGGAAVTVQANSAMQFLWNDNEVAWFPVNQPQPAPQLALAPSGATGETFPRQEATTYLSSLTSEAVYCSAIPLPGGLTVNNISMVLGGSAFTTVDVTHGWYALLDSSRIVRAVSADQTSGNWGTTFTTYTLPVTSGGTYTTTYGGLYYTALCITFTAASGEFVAGPSTIGGVGGVAPILSGTSSTLMTTPPGLGGTITTISNIPADRFYAWTT